MSAAAVENAAVEADGELPEGWTRSKLASLLTPGGLFDGPFGSSLKTSDYTDSGVRVIRLENLSNLRFIASKRTFISKAKYADLKKHTVREGDVLVGSFVDGAVRVCVLPALDTLAIAKADCFCVRPEAEVLDPRFLAYQLGATRTRDALVEQIHGATRPRITTKQLREFELLLCPVAEQRRIVAKVEELLAQVNAACERLSKIPALLRRFRQSVLAAACSGRLTEEWRRHNPAIAAESEAAKTEDGGDLPERWRWARVDAVGEIRGGIQKQPKRTPKKNHFPYLRVANVLRGRLDLDELEQMELFGAELDLYRLEPGDLLVVEGNGSLTEIGRSALWGGQVSDCVHQNHIIRVRPTRCLPEYLDLYWNSPVCTSQVAEKAVTTSGLYSLSTKKIASVLIALPPRAEQVEIVRRVDALFKLADTIEARVAACTARADKLTQAVLAKAFRGALVPTEADLARREGRPLRPAAESLTAPVHQQAPIPERRPRPRNTGRAAVSGR